MEHKHNERLALSAAERGGEMKMPRRASIEGRRLHAKESFLNAAKTIGDIEAGMSIFAITRGQFSMIDAVLHVLDRVGNAKVSLWTWTVAEYEVQCLERLRMDKKITHGRLIIDASARKKNAGIIRDWKEAFGPDSVRYVANHSKIATVEGEKHKVLLRGSMNLNYNPRFEQLDVTEGGGAFDLVRRIEESLPVLPDDASNHEVWAASGLHVFSADELQFFGKVKTWAK